MSVHRPIDAADPAVSVVISSVPANDHAAVVRHLRAQRLEAPYEVLVVDDASVDRSTARNRGLRAAGAPIVALTDDDTEPPDDWLATALDAFRTHPELVCLEGAVHGGARYRGSRHYVGCNLAVSREAALDVGGFDETYAGWREDTEFGWRMERDTDGVCRFDPEFRMYHPSVPRSPIDPAHERRLAREYPERYAAILDTPYQRLRRRARITGVAPWINRRLNRLRNVFSARP